MDRLPLHYSSNNRGFSGKLKFLNGFMYSWRVIVLEDLSGELVVVCFLYLNSTTVPTLHLLT